LRPRWSYQDVLSVDPRDVAPEPALSVGAHGLRKAAARRLAEAGCSTHEIAAITGHASLKEVARYTEAADRKRLAQSAMAKVRTLSDKPDKRFVKKG